jgi:hypothetical protein
MRNKFLAAFRTIVDIITDTRATREQFKSSADPRKSALELYDAILCTIQELTIRLNEKRSTKKRLQKIFRPALTAEELSTLHFSLHGKTNSWRAFMIIYSELWPQVSHALFQDSLVPPSKT